MFHLPRFQRDHNPILVRTKPRSLRRKKQFRSENWWHEAKGFAQVCEKVGEAELLGWQSTVASFKKEVNTWVKTSKTPSQILTDIEDRMKEVNIAT